MAMVEAADSLAQNSPWGLENDAMKVVSGAAVEVVRLRLQKASFQAQDDRQQRGRRDARQGQRHQQVDQLLLGLGAVHAAGLEDVLGHLLEEGVEHPDHDRQVDQREDDGQADAGIEQPEIAEDQVHRHQHADRRQHLGRQHPEQHVLGPLLREEGHGIGRRDRQREREQGRADRDDHAVRSEAEIVGALLDHGIVLERRREEQRRGRGHRLDLGLEAREEHPEDREEDQGRDQPADDRQDQFVPGCVMHGPCPQLSRFLAIARTRKIATMLARMIAITPPADAEPTSNSSRARV